MRLGTITACLALALCALCAQPLPLAAAPRGAKGDKEKKLSPAEAQAKELLDKATALTNIEAPTSPGFVMIAHFKFAAAKKNYEGSETLQWSSPDLGRSQFSAGSYTRVRVVARDKMYLAQSSNYLPFPGQQWQSML